MASLTDWQSRTTSFGYDTDGRRTTVTLPNGVVSATTYDAAGRTTAVNHTLAANTLQGFTYNLDAAGNRTGVTSTAGSESYTLDALSRITNVSYPGGSSVSYTYDHNGNRLTKTAGGTTSSYTYDAAGELTSDGTNTYTYDANGNLTARGSDSFSYDAASRMTGATVGGTATSYAYDGDGVRTAKTVGAGTPITYLWDRESGLPLLVDDGASAYLQANGPVEDIDGSGTASYHLGDALGSTRGLTDGSGAVTGTLDYDVFGATRSASGATSALAFTGQQSDAETGFTFLRSRYLDPSVGRFTTADSVQPNAPGTQGYNLYSYVANNPARWADPSGHLVAPAAGFAGVWEELTLQDALWQGCLRMPDCSPLLVQSVGLASEGRYNPAVTNGAIALLVCALEADCRTLAFRLEKTLVENAPRVGPLSDPASNPESSRGPVDPPVPVPPVARPPDRCGDLNRGQLPILFTDRVDKIRNDHGAGGSGSGSKFSLHRTAPLSEWEEFLQAILDRARPGSWKWDTLHQTCYQVVPNPPGAPVRIGVYPDGEVATMFPQASAR
jgi:RHS repeat-associated protein